MKIVLVGTAYPLRGGIAHYIGLLWKHLTSRGHELRVVTFSRQYPKLLFPGKSQSESGDAGIPLHSEQWIDSINPFSWWRAARRIRAMRPDLVIFKYWMPFFAPAYGVIARQARRGGAVTMFICDNVIPHERRPGDRLLTRYAFRAVDCHVVQSHAVERDLARWQRDPRYALLPHPVYEIFGEERGRAEARAALARINPALAEREAGERQLLFFGYVRDYKGLDVLLDAMPRVLARMPARLFVVGEFYNDEQRYRDQARRLGIEGVVEFHAAYVPNEQVADFFSAADLLALPYKSATQSGIIQIAYNFARPVIATDVGGLGEVIANGRTGYLVPPNDPEALARAIGEYFAGDAAAFRREIVEERKKYSWEHFCNGIEELYGRARAARAGARGGAEA